MKFFKQSVAIALGFLLIAGAAFAQGQQMQQQQAQPDSITDAELEKFVAVTSEVQRIQQESQKKVQAILADTDLDMQRFQKIMMSRQNPQLADSIEVTEEEQKIIEEVKPKLMKMQQSSRKEMMGAMQENGLNPQRFQAIMKAVQSNPEVMKRFQKVAQDSAQ
jgi:hypothetical protein